MPVIDIEYDGKTVSDGEAQLISEAAHKIVSEVTEIEDVPVYSNSSKIRVKVAPIEIFVRMSDHKIKDLDALTDKIKARFVSWKKEANFKHAINLTVIPMHWKIEIGI